MREQNQTLLQTKLHRPRLTRNLVIRSHLFERLNRGLESPLTLVCAAAGFGKTTLVSSWVKSLTEDNHHQNPDWPVMWLSMDEKDSDLFLFLRYFIAAIQSKFPGKCANTLELVHSISQPPLSLLANTLGNEIDSLPRDFILVLDDYSSIRGRVIHDFLNMLLEHWPRTMHLVMITRSDPPLPLAKLRARGEMIEIRSRDLRFSHQDTLSYLNKVLPAALSETILAPLEQRIEGWIAGMQLAVLSLLNSNDPQAFLTAMSSANTDTATYLLDEVLYQQPPAIQNFLLKTSILDRFSKPLCQALLEDENSEWSVAACLEWIKHANLFIIPIDQEDEWYRYHHLFQELLQQRVRQESNAGQLYSLHHKAAIWYASQGLIDDAIHHYLKADALDQAAELIEQAMREALDREDRVTIDRWLGLLPEEYIKSRPGLLVFRVLVSRLNVDFRAKSPHLHLVETLLGQHGDTYLQSKEMKNVIEGLVKSLYAREAFFNNQADRAIQLCQEALFLLPDWPFLRGRALMYLGISLHAAGQDKTAERLLLDHYQALSDKTGIEACCILIAQGINLLQDNKLLQAANSFKAVVRQTSYEKIAMLRIWALFFLAQIYYKLDDLVTSRQYLAEIVDHRYFAVITFYCQALAGMATIDQFGWKTTQARDSLEQLSQFDLEHQGYEAFSTQSLRAHLSLLRGDYERAGSWADEFQEPVPQEPMLWIEIPHLTQVRILLHRNLTGDLARALSILDELEEVARYTRNMPVLIQIYALRSMILNTQGSCTDALFTLEQTVQMAVKGGNIRVFVDLGKPMKDMLGRLAEQGRSLEMIRRILKAFSPEEQAQISTENLRQPVQDPLFSNLTLAEPLTTRELEVLALLREPLSTKEIAQKLNISYATAKRHTINIYGKLGVNGRWNAVAKAVELGILPYEVYTTS